MVVRWSHRCLWKAIARGFLCFTQFTRLQVGNGERIRFWEDIWFGDQLLCLQFPDLCRVMSVRNLSGSVVLGYSPPSTLNLILWLDLTDSEIEHF